MPSSRVTRVALPLSLLLLCAASAALAEAVPVIDKPLNRNGYVSVTMTPLLYESNLWQTSYMDSLEQLFRTRAESFAESLAEGLEKSAFRGNLRVIPGYLPKDHNALRSEVGPDHFLIAVDLNSSYGLSNGSSLAACLSGASCFLLSPIEMFTFKSRIEASVSAYYIDPDGKRLRLVQSRHTSKGEVSGDFFDAMDLTRELEWITLLTDEGLSNLKRKILADLPAELVWRAWSKVAEALSQTPTGGTLGRAMPPALAAAVPLPAPAETPTPGNGNNRRPAGQELGLQGVVRQVSPSVFKVRTEQGTGSGFVLSRRGYGLTSLHVVEGAEKVTIRFHSGEELEAKMVLSEPALDLAVLSFPAGGLTPLPLGDSDRLTVGEQVIAIGYPLDLGLSVVPGAVSSLEPYRGTPLIRIDAALPSGNSGGPLVNAQGEGVGINFRKGTGAGEETTFGIPINAARRLFAHLLDTP